ncbi:MAG: alpha/beta hydrolase-fold protein [Cellvibrionaceae bacterium]|nr:alpha/beta hydrolase-fold protein [Cellvibrionaceae bacterium]
MSMRTLVLSVAAVGVFIVAGLAVMRVLGIRLPQTTKPVVWVNPWENPPPRLQHLAFPSAAMGHKVGVSILPPAHREPASLIIFLHGRGGDEVSDLPAFMDMLRAVTTAEGLPEPLVVFPNGGLSEYRGAMATMIVEELLPYLEQHYRLRPERHHRLLIGFSMGGAGAVRLQLEYPEVFGGAVSWGGGVWHGDTALFDSVLTRADLLRALDPHFLLVNGSEDRPDAYAPLVAVFEQTGLAHKRVVLDGVGHGLGLYFERSAEPFAGFLRELWVERN